MTSLPGHEMVVVSLEIDDSSGFVKRDAPEDVVEGRVGRDAGDDGAKRVEEIGSESIDLKKRV